MNCRLCGGLLRIVLDLGSVPPANRYRRSGELLLPEPIYPLRLAECEQCCHVQLGDPQPSGLFTDRPYLYQSGVSKSWHRHCQTLAQQVPQGRGRLALDLGSNDGTMLGYLTAIGYNAVGVDPSVEANASHGYQTITAAWIPEVAHEVVQTRGRSALIIAQNVLAHVEDARSFLEACAIALAPDGQLIVECPDLCAMVQGADFTPIYHEHVHYWDQNKIQWFARLAGDLRLRQVDPLLMHCGSNRYWLDFGPLERIFAAAYNLDAFADRITAFRQDWTQQLAAYRDAGEVLAGYGASAKAMTLLTTTPVPEAISWIVDDGPAKQGWYTPGAPIPIVPLADLGKPDRVVILAWNVATEIAAKLRARGYEGPITTPFPLAPCT